MKAQSGSSRCRSSRAFGGTRTNGLRRFFSAPTTKGCALKQHPRAPGPALLRRKCQSAIATRRPWRLVLPARMGEWGHTISAPGEGDKEDEGYEGHKEEDAPMLEQGGKPDAPMFHKRHFDKDDRDKFPTLVEMAEYFGLGEDKTWKFNDQLVSDQLPNHIDNLPGIPSKERVIDNPDFGYNLHKARFLVFLGFYFL